MSFLAGRASLVGLYHHRRPLLSVSQSEFNTTTAYYLLSCFYPRHSTKRWLSASAESTQTELAGENAYELLGVSETSSFTEIKASFRKLAKETHPDLAQLPNSERFVQILAAYEILSDCEKRANYDRYLLSQRLHVHRCPGQVSVMYTYELNRSAMKQMDVVEWLKWYRFALHDILSEKRMVAGSSYFDELERDFYSAIHAAYYGPLVESLDLLPDCFEAEERSTYATPEVLHLVSGRDLFGLIRLADKVPKLSRFHHEKLTTFTSDGSCQGKEQVWIKTNSGKSDDGICSKADNIDYQESDAYRDLEFHVSGKVVAVATRVPPKSYRNGIRNEDSEDHIHIYLSSNEYKGKKNSKDSMGVPVGSMIPLGRINGLGTSPDEGSCFVYNCNGIKTHAIMKHRTLLGLANPLVVMGLPQVKHMHWYEVGHKVSVCECRCSRARLPPSRYWLFEPRCSMHDIGGWYVETFGKDRKGHTVPSKRFWDGSDADEQFEKRLHPATYLLALAYRTLDLEDEKRRKQTTRGIVEGKLFGLISWCKKLV